MRGVTLDIRRPEARRSSRTRGAWARLTGVDANGKGQGKGIADAFQTK